MLCPKCNVEVKEGAIFCHVCGSIINEPSENKAPSSDSPKQEPYGPATPKTETSKVEEKIDMKTFTDVKSDEVISNVKSGSLFKRVFAIMFSPIKEWGKVAQEKPKIPMIVFGYLLILSIVAFTAIIFGYLINWWGLRFGYGSSFFLPIIFSAMKFIALFATPVIAAIIINMICPSFKIEKNFGKALQLMAYSFTPVYIAMTISWIPLGFFDFLVNLVGLYGILILLMGYRKILNIPVQRQLGFFFTAAGILYGVYYILYLMIYIIQLPFSRNVYGF